MSGRFDSPLVLDTTVLSNYAACDGIERLRAELGPLLTVPAVADELRRGADAHDHLTSAVEAVETGRIPTADEAPARLDEEYPEIGTSLDRGEAEALVATIDSGGTFASDDAAGRALADRWGVPLTGSIGIVVYAVERGFLDLDTADNWHDQWTATADYRSPVESVTAYFR
jgi:predicted nucleic acid-binding protein